MSANRRAFLQRSLAASTLVALGEGTVPLFLGRSASAASAEESSKRSDRILVVVQLIGGNDGINTVVPHGLDGYARGRRALRLPTGQIHKVTKEIGLHPSMGQLAKVLDDGHLSILQGVGYPNPDRSHFRSMEIWESARLESDALETGWLGRALDRNAAQAGPGGDVPALHVAGRGLPLALKARKADVPSLETLEQFTLKVGGDASTRQAIDQAARAERPADDLLLGFIQRSTLAAYTSSARLEALMAGQRDKKAAAYPTNFGLARRLSLIAQIIKAGFNTRFYYTSLDGFDTHANQIGSHAALLNELSDSLAAFRSDLKAAGQADRVAVLCFSEFGRRVAENGSAGTDHGAAAPVFVMGPVRSEARGLVGAHPSLEDLDDGDLKFHTDFRRVYASLLQDWLGVPAEPVLGPGFAPLQLFARA